MGNITSSVAVMCKKIFITPHNIVRRYFMYKLLSNALRVICPEAYR